MKHSVKKLRTVLGSRTMFTNVNLCEVWCRRSVCNFNIGVFGNHFLS